jgi:hypothetical protein
MITWCFGPMFLTWCFRPIWVRLRMVIETTQIQQEMGVAKERTDRHTIKAVEIVAFAGSESASTCRRCRWNWPRIIPSLLVVESRIVNNFALIIIISTSAANSSPSTWRIRLCLLTTWRSVNGRCFMAKWSNQLLVILPSCVSPWIWTNSLYREPAEREEQISNSHFIEFMGRCQLYSSDPMKSCWKKSCF